MTQYFSKITADYWTSKNKLQEEYKRVAKLFDRELIPARDIPKWLNQFKQHIEQANLKYPRCKPIEPNIWKSSLNKDDTLISVSGVFQITLYLVKLEIQQP